MTDCCSKKFPTAAIARVMQVSQQWLQAYVNGKYTTLPQEVQVTPKPKRRLTVQLDEQESFVNDKDQEQWVWLAMDADTRHARNGAELINPTVNIDRETSS